MIAGSAGGGKHVQLRTENGGVAIILWAWRREKLSIVAARSHTSAQAVRRPVLARPVHLSRRRDHA